MAAVKIDKEVLIKHHFWILSGLFLLLVLIPMFLLGMSVSDSVAKEQTALETTKKNIKAVPSTPKNNDWINTRKKADVVVVKRRDVVWEQAWYTQANMMTWPEAIHASWSQKYKYMGDPIDQFDDQQYIESYDSQLAEVFYMVQPVLDNGEGVVQFPGGGWANWDNVFHLKRSFTHPPLTAADIWLAQEDVWVKRELARIIRDANDAVAFFREVTPEPAPAKEKAEAKSKEDKADAKDAAATAAKDAKPPKPAAPKSDPNHKLFRNSYWELDLTLAPGKSRGKYSLRGTIKNIGKRKEPLGDFLVYLDDRGAAPVRMPVEMLPLSVGQKADLKPVDVPDTATVSGLYGVEQVLTWRTGVVKRIDDLRLDSNSSRTAHKTLIKPLWITKAEEAATQQAGADPAAQPAPPAEGKFTGGAGGTMPGFMGGGRQGGAGGAVSKNGLVLNRYTDANSQVRHMPVAMVVIVDEDHIPEFLAAFANSRLRIETLQMHWNHIREKIKPEPKESPGATNKPPPVAGNLPQMPNFRPGSPGGGGKMMGMGAMGGGDMAMNAQAMMRGYMGMGRGQMSGMGMGSFGGQPGSLGPTRTATLGDEEEEAEMNLVELAVYGIASLYERYPPKPEAAPTPAASQPAAAPASK
jgi:hypothetical protein